MKVSNKIKYYRLLDSKGYGFVANVLSTYSKPTTKLKKAWNIVKEGDDIRFAQFDISTLVITKERTTETIKIWDF